MELTPKVTAVIPTRNRPQLVTRAVRSALRQTYRQIEVVVVVDGPDGETEGCLAEIQDPRLRIVVLETSRGGSGARNAGVEAARGEWIAFLDDDDEWLPEKIAKQVSFASELKDSNVFLAARYIVRSTNGEDVLPYRLPDPGERIDEYLFCPKGFRGAEGGLQTSNIFASRELLLRVPFVQGLKRGQEYMWMVSACHYGNAKFHVMADVLSIFNIEGFSDGNRISSKPKWRSQYEWMKQHKECFTRRTYACCIALNLMMDAMRCCEPESVKLRLLKDSIISGPPPAKHLLLVTYRLLLPDSVRTQVRAKVWRTKKASATSAQLSA